MKTSTQRAVLAFDLGGTKLAGALFAEDGTILQKTVVPLDGRKGADVGALIGQQMAGLQSAAAQKGVSISSVGACVPGIAYQKTGRVWAPNIPGWEDYPLRDELASRLGNGSVVVDSDRAASIMGEVWQGAAKGCNNAIFLAVGTGIGAGILANGEILRGANDIAGAIGWMALDRPYRPEYLPCGCFEHHAAGNGLAKIAAELLVTEKKYAGVLKGRSTVTAHDVFENFRSGDLVAVKTLNQAIEFWGMAVANLVSLFDPEKIIFGGGVFGPAAQYLPEIFAEAWKWSQPISIKHVHLEISKLAGDAGLYGAGYLALKAGQGKR